MANRYWVGGTANWDNTAGTKWATTSGGAGGAAVPTNADDVFFDANSGAVTVTSSYIGNFCKSLTCTGFTGTLTCNASTSISAYGNITFSSGMTLSGSGNFGIYATSTITSAGKTFPGNLSVNNGVAVTLADALSAAGSLQLVQGTFDASSYNVTVATVSSSNTNTRTLTMGSGLWTLTGTGTVWDLATKTNLTFNKNTANILLSNTTTTARTFAGSSLTYNKLTIGGTTGTSTLTFTGSNTFSELATTKTVAHTMTFTAGTTTTVTTWSISGTSGNVVTLGSSTTSAFTLAKAGGGTVSANYLSISYSTATPSTTWYAGANSTDGGNNSGWIFSAPSLGTAFLSILARRV